MQPIKLDPGKYPISDGWNLQQTRGSNPQAGLSPLDALGPCLTISTMRSLGSAANLSLPSRALSGQALRRPAMTLVEMTIALCGMLVSLFLLVGWTATIREGAKLALAERVLSDLDVALARYYRATGCYPASHAPDSAIKATVYLLDFDKTRPILTAFPPAVWSGPGQRNLVDPWGMPLRFYPADSESPYVRGNEGRPVFVSAGPDCGFGDLDPSQLGDNLRSDDPGADGFRLDHLMREPRTEREQQRDKEDNRPGGSG